MARKKTAPSDNGHPSWHSTRQSLLVNCWGQSLRVELVGLRNRASDAPARRVSTAAGAAGCRRTARPRWAQLTAGCTGESQLPTCRVLSVLCGAAACPQATASGPLVCAVPTCSPSPSHFKLSRGCAGSRTKPDSQCDRSFQRCKRWDQRLPSICDPKCVTYNLIHHCVLGIWLLPGSRRLVGNQTSNCMCTDQKFTGAITSRAHH